MARKKPALFGDLSQTTPPEPPAAPQAQAAPMVEEQPLLPVSMPHVRPSRNGKKVIAGHFPPSSAKALAMLALEQDKTLQAILAEALNDLFRKNGKHPIF